MSHKDVYIEVKPKAQDMLMYLNMFLQQATGNL